MPIVASMVLAAVAAASKPTAAERVERRMGELVAPDGPGCVLSVTRLGRTELSRVWGLADLELRVPIGTDTVFEAGSVSKQFTAAALAVLAAQGRLSLDDDVRRYLPELPSYEATITLRMLLNHTSGLRNWDDLVELQGWPEGTRIYTPAYVLRLIAQQRALNFRPGAEYLYSNSNYVLAALVAERVSGMGLNAFMRGALFDRLGLGDTRWRDDFAAVVPRRAQAYDKQSGGPWRLDMPFGNVIGPGALLTTVGDLQRWNAVLSDPGPADAAWVRLMTVRGRLADGTETRYALGLESESVGGAEVLSHAGATAGYRAYLARATRTGVSLALLCNAGNLNTEDLGPELLAAYLPVPSPAPDAPPASTQRAPDPNLAGDYRNLQTDAVVHATLKLGGLSLDGGGPYVERRPGAFVNATGTRTLTVAPGRLSITRTGNSPVELARLAPDERRRPSFRDFVGVYHSGEVGAEARIALGADGQPTWTNPLGGTARMIWIYGDTFDVPDGHWTASFTRDANQRVGGLRLSSTRTRRVSFVRRSADGSARERARSR